jgi:hypothetical protein
VTPSVRKVSSKRRTATAQASSHFVLSENIAGSGSDSEDEIVFIQQLRKKIRKPVPSPPESSQEVQVVEQVEVESQDLPKTCPRLAQDLPKTCPRLATLPKRAATPGLLPRSSSLTKARPMSMLLTTTRPGQRATSLSTSWRKTANIHTGS